MAVNTHFIAKNKTKQKAQVSRRHTTGYKASPAGLNQLPEERSHQPGGLQKKLALQNWGCKWAMLLGGIILLRCSSCLCLESDYLSPAIMKIPDNSRTDRLYCTVWNTRLSSHKSPCTLRVARTGTGRGPEVASLFLSSCVITFRVSHCLTQERRAVRRGDGIPRLGVFHKQQYLLHWRKLWF